MTREVEAPDRNELRRSHRRFVAAVVCDPTPNATGRWLAQKGHAGRALRLPEALK